MPNKKFLEDYPLYRKFTAQIPDHLGKIPKVRIKMMCAGACNSEQTFIQNNEYYESEVHEMISAKGKVCRLFFKCAGCENTPRYFIIKIAVDLKSVMKIGQYPPWDVSGDKNIERMLGDHADYFRRGLISESQGYGIGAFAYYRRIVEETIDELLADVADLLSDNEREKYEVVLRDVENTRQTVDKLNLVKDMLPPILTPNGMNPLKVLHKTLSEGLHAESEEKCLEYAVTIRSLLAFLSTQIASTKNAAKEFSDDMRLLLDKKAGK